MKNQFIERSANKNSIAKRKPVHSVGINDADYVVTNNSSGKQMMCPYYRVWKGMLGRCYSGKEHERRPNYINCSVCADWVLFSKFKKWMITQKWKGKQLDKDIINPGNKVYSPDGCAFVSRAVNQVMCDAGSIRGKYPIGVSLSKSCKKFEVHARIWGVVENLGYYVGVNDAANAYKKAKRKYILELASTQSDKRVADGLRLHANLLL